MRSIVVHTFSSRMNEGDRPRREVSKRVAEAYPSEDANSTRRSFDLLAKALMESR